MPHYEFFCKACMKTFSKVLTFTEYEESKIMCPHCGSREVEQQVSPFSVTSKKSQSSAQENAIPPSQNEDSWDTSIYLQAKRMICSSAFRLGKRRRCFAHGKTGGQRRRRKVRT